jgi:hypothetical protein
MERSDLGGVKAYVECHISHLVARPFCFYSGILDIHDREKWEEAEYGQRSGGKQCQSQTNS